jgi:hypothetical protein
VSHIVVLELGANDGQGVLLTVGVDKRRLRATPKVLIVLKIRTVVRRLL